MATVLDQNKDKDEQGNGPQSVTPGQGGGPIMGGGMQGAQNSQAPASPKGTSSGRFTNIQKYLKANQGTDYAGQIGEKTEKEASSVREGIEAAKNKAQESAQPELQRLQQAGSLTEQAINDPTAFAANQQNLSAFQQIRQGQYNPNVALENEGGLANQAQGIAGRAQMAGTEQGRFQLLRDQFGQTPGKNYSKGAQRFDQLLLQGQGGQLGQLAQRSQAAAQGTQDALSGAQQAVAGTKSQIEQMGQQAQQQAEQALGGKITSEQERLQGLAARTQSQREAEFENLRSGLEKGEVTEEQARQLGFNPDDPNSLRLYGNSPLQYLNKNALGQASIGNVAGAEDQARMEALAKLSGRQDLEDYADVSGPLGTVSGTFNQDAIRQQQQAGQARIGDISAQFQQQRSPLDQKTHDLMRNATGNWLGEGAAGRDRMANMSPGELANELMKKNSDGRNSMTPEQIAQYNTQSDTPGSPGYDLRQAQKQRQAMLDQEAAAKDSAGYNQLLKIIRAQQVGA